MCEVFSLFLTFASTNLPPILFPTSLEKAVSFTTGPISWFTASHALSRVLYAKRSIVANGNQEQSVTAGVHIIIHTALCSSMAHFTIPLVLHRRRMACERLWANRKLYWVLLTLFLSGTNITCSCCLSHYDSASCCSWQLRLAKNQPLLAVCCTRQQRKIPFCNENQHMKQY